MNHLRSDPISYLSEVDPVMCRLIQEIGPFSLKPKGRRSPFESLVRAIAYQQLQSRRVHPATVYCALSRPEVSPSR